MYEANNVNYVIRCSLGLFRAKSRILSCKFKVVSSLLVEKRKSNEVEKVDKCREYEVTL